MAQSRLRLRSPRRNSAAAAGSCAGRRHSIIRAMRLRECMAVAGVLAAGAAAWLGTMGCGGAEARRHQLRSLNPLDRAEAVVAVSAAGDLNAVHKLVDLLDDSDSAVRMYAILALRRLCGEDLGYRFYEGAAAREPAVQRWRAALRAGTIELHPTSQPWAETPPPENSVR